MLSDWCRRTFCSDRPYHNIVAPDWSLAAKFFSLSRFFFLSSFLFVVFSLPSHQPVVVGPARTRWVSFSRCRFSFVSFFYWHLRFPFVCVLLPRLDCFLYSITFFFIRHSSSSLRFVVPVFFVRGSPFLFIFWVLAARFFYNPLWPSLFHYLDYCDGCYYLPLDCYFLIARPAVTLPKSMD